MGILWSYRVLCGTAWVGKSVSGGGGKKGEKVTASEIAEAKVKEDALNEQGLPLGVRRRLSERMEGGRGVDEVRSFSLLPGPGSR